MTVVVSLRGMRRIGQVSSKDLNAGEQMRSANFSGQRGRLRSSQTHTSCAVPYDKNASSPCNAGCTGSDETSYILASLVQCCQTGAILLETEQ